MTLGRNPGFSLMFHPDSSVHQHMQDELFSLCNSRLFSKYNIKLTVFRDTYFKSASYRFSKKWVQVKGRTSVKTSVLQNIGAFMCFPHYIKQPVILNKLRRCCYDVPINLYVIDIYLQCRWGIADIKQSLKTRNQAMHYHQLDDVNPIHTIQLPVKGKTSVLGVVAFRNVYWTARSQSLVQQFRWGGPDLQTQMAWLRVPSNIPGCKGGFMVIFCLFCGTAANQILSIKNGLHQQSEPMLGHIHPCFKLWGLPFVPHDCSRRKIHLGTQ